MTYRRLVLRNGNKFTLDPGRRVGGTPATGDTAVPLWIWIMIAAAVVVVMIVTLRKRCVRK